MTAAELRDAIAAEIALGGVSETDIARMAAEDTTGGSELSAQSALIEDGPIAVALVLYLATVGAIAYVMLHFVVGVL